MSAETFGSWLRDEREARGLTLRDVERITEGAVSNPALSQVENGRIENPSLGFIVHIAAAYGLPATLIFEKARLGFAPPPTPDRCPTCGRTLTPERRD